MKIIKVTTGSNYDIDVCKGAVISIVLIVTGNITLSASNFDQGDVVFLTLIQDATGSRVITFNSDYHWNGGTTPTPSTAAGAKDTFMFVCSETKLMEMPALDVKT